MSSSLQIVLSNLVAANFLLTLHSWGTVLGSIQHYFLLMLTRARVNIAMLWKQMLWLSFFFFSTCLSMFFLFVLAAVYLFLNLILKSCSIPLPIFFFLFYTSSCYLFIHCIISPLSVSSICVSAYLPFLTLSLTFSASIFSSSQSCFLSCITSFTS